MEAREKMSTHENKHNQSIILNKCQQYFKKFHHIFDVLIPACAVHGAEIVEFNLELH